MHKLLDKGYRIFNTCYEDPSYAVKLASQRFCVVKAVRVRTDTPGLKMFAVLVK